MTFRPHSLTATSNAAAVEGQGENMTDTSYRIVHRDDDSFAVEIVRVGALPQTAAGFPTEAAARGWIARDERFRYVTDPFWAPAGRPRGY
jgi:hypothetical protein